MLLILLLVLSFVGIVTAATDPPTTAPAPPCPEKWKEIGSMCYWYSDNVFRPWSGAQSFCNDIGGNLAGTTDKTLADVEKLISSTLYTTWTGLNKINATNWQFVDGTLFLASQWSKGEPGDGRGNCGAIRSSPVPDNNGYIALGCQYSQPFLCSQKFASCPDTNFTSIKGSLTSPNYPDNYANNEYCIQRIIAPSGYFIALTFDAWIVQKDKDAVLIYDGYYPSAAANLMATITVDPTNSTLSPYPNSFQTKSNVMSVIFKSDSLINYKGWHANYQSFTPTDPGYQNGTSGTLTSPNYPNNYPNDVEQYQYVTTANGTQIQATFSSFAVEGLYNDYLLIFDGPDQKSPVIGNFSGLLAGVPDSVKTSGNAMTLYFFTNSLINFKGFSLDWTIV
ncbi:unnamed protein product, partial [Mesorhabditis belari]|uniref:Uncharacterized protein n=1 Tax=Mesorhabditis belari TaxID=2138241 RepID=A0AAF3F4G7_9BILA